jgi:hypothetical protein
MRVAVHGAETKFFSLQILFLESHVGDQKTPRLYASGVNDKQWKHTLMVISKICHSRVSGNDAVEFI